MKYKFEEHCQDESLELYALGKLDDAVTELLEEHILICEPCRTRLDEADRYVQAMRSGAARIQVEERAKSWSFANPFRGLPRLTPVWVTTAVTLCGLAVLGSLANWRADGSRAPVTLQAERGTSTIGPAHRGLDLKLHVQGLQLGSAPREEIVDADGRVVQKSAAPARADIVEIRTDRGLNPGMYFVRVFPSGTQEAAREYALELK